MINRIVICIIVFGSFYNICTRKYTDFTLFRCVPVNESHLNFLIELNKKFDVIYWREPKALYAPVDFVINPVYRGAMLRLALKLELYVSVIMENVQEAFNEQTVRKYIRRKMETMNWYNYFNLEDINTWLRDLANQYPSRVTLESIGKSYEDRDIMVVKVAANGSSLKSKVIIEGCIHAREWISPAVVTYLINEIVQAPWSKDAGLKQIADMYEWYFLPVVNPDGFVYTHTNDRLWRKNRNHSGIDLNRNFDIDFGTDPDDWNEVEETYCGEEALSEVETQVMAAFIKAARDRLKYYISFHSYGQYMILAGGNSSKYLDNYEKEWYAMCKEASNKILENYNTSYIVGTELDTVGYRTSGTSTSWAKNNLSVPYVVTFELRDRGSYGFALPTDQIMPTCEETLDGLLNLLSYEKETKTKTGDSSSKHKLKPNQILNMLFLVKVILR